MTELELKINGKKRTVDVNPHRTLRDVLRQELNLTGTKKSCDSGYCGVCSVHIDGDVAKSCLTPIGKAEGKNIKTVEALSSDGDLSDVQQSFVDCFASQCGYCMPGFVMAAEDLLEDNPSPTEDEIRKGINGNICRCTGYVKIVESISEAADRREESV